MRAGPRVFKPAPTYKSYLNSKACGGSPDRTLEGNPGLINENLQAESPV